MSKSQNAKNEQQNDLYITDDTLTEQWKNGELPDGLYYVENNKGNIGILGWSKFAGWYDIKKVLAPVPSYEEWQAKLEENAQLKELLKECVEVLNDAQRNYGYDDSIIDICYPVITKIDEALR